MCLLLSFAVGLQLLLKNTLRAEHQWLTPVILATWEADITKTEMKPDWANSLRDPISKITRAKQLEVCLKEYSACFASAKP
jgi:hypothetical protein